MDEGLNGKVAIVTGGGAVHDGIGNGRAAAILLADAGARVLVVDQNAGAADRTVEMIGEKRWCGPLHLKPKSALVKTARRWLRKPLHYGGAFGCP
ncbi:MAG: hypothetical protein Ct9H300mP8_10070 [Gammaproteobacteria bacterium]|nr:MAG: hypothetical protein Ct9H300mP8_10070 [Gammaproteobacteria bacterium]